MKKTQLAMFGAACALLGAFAQPGIAAAKKLAFTSDLLTGKSDTEKAATLLDGAAELADGGSWELIAVGRAWYLGGDKEKGQALFDQVTATKKVEASDWYRIGSVYVEAHEADKAKDAFEHFVSLSKSDDEAVAQYGAMLIVLGDIAKGEAAVTQSLTKHPRDFWGWLAVGGAYLGVAPMP